MRPTYQMLVDRFEQPLPGEASHQSMYPRKGISLDHLQPSVDARLSAVAILLFDGTDYLQSIVIQRSVYEGSHSGQIAFPGGKWEINDPSLMDTALRECAEEIGIVAHELDYIGKLTDVYTAVSSFLIEPHVFYWKRPHDQFTLSEREVAAVHTLDLSTLLDDKIVQLIDVPIQQGMVLKNVPHFIFEEVKIWGATALMLSELKEVLRSIKGYY